MSVLSAVSRELVKVKISESQGVMNVAWKVDDEISDLLLGLYHCLFEHYGLQHWWPTEEPFEVMVGAILTQSATWSNVEKSIVCLKRGNALSPSALRQLSTSDIAEMIYSSGYYNAKAAKLKSLAVWLGECYGDNLERLFSLPLQNLRDVLLSVYGIGEETADSVILYAARKPIFVIDAYTRRIIHRLGLSAGDGSYCFLQGLFMEHLPNNEKLFNEYHALLVRHGKEVCRKRPRCSACCVNSICSCYPGIVAREATTH